ncbi:hypothetical protein HMPREF9098_1562 [Kingella denitrificans ATCC 33394]|uniref:Uncharacterized protein n=1 Tax=Kingella denitrificans ATCC 33394 TaxID=888741 RepID=F0F0C8_9NEIS|nr:hypothetical protein HMPREF9098_1562 [Kingella denitrificans ATCC 33394]
MQVFCIEKSSLHCKKRCAGCFLWLKRPLVHFPSVKVSDYCNTANSVTLSPILPAGII